MPSMPNDYDPTRRFGRKRLPPPCAISHDAPAVATNRPVFGRKATPIEPAAMEPICPHECRMIEFGGCDGPCRLMARSDKEEPKWPTPETS